jgi:hypothetical protein
VTDPESRRAARIATLIAIPAALLAGVLALWLAGGFGGPGNPPKPKPRPTPTAPVSMAARDLSTHAAEVCRALLSDLPDSVRDLPRRPVTAGAEQNAAYGEPPVRLTCGVPEPKFAATATVYPLSGVCWLPRKADDGTVWTTVDREVPVAVTVPGPRAESGQWAAAFSRYVKKTPVAKDVPSGCRG